MKIKNYKLFQFPPRPVVINYLTNVDKVESLEILNKIPMTLYKP